MKSAYCAAIFLCSAMLWLQEKKKACGIDQNRYLKTAVGYGLTRFLLPVIAQQSMKGSVTVLAMDLVICGLVFYLSKRDSEQSYAAESLFFYVWNPVPAMAALSQEKNRMVVIWLSVLIFVWMVRCTEKNAEKDADSDKSSGVAYSYRLWSLSGVLWIWGRDIAGQSIRQYIAGDGAYPVLLLLSVIAGIAAVLCAGWVMLGSACRRRKLLAGSPDERKSDRWSGKDWCMMLGLTLLFGMLAFAHLGSTRAPQSGYRFEKGESGKQEMILYFDQSVTIRTLEIYLGVKEKRSFTLFVPNAAGDGWDQISEPVNVKSVFCWNSLPVNYRTYALAIISQDDIADVMEIVILDQDGQRVLPKNVERYPEAFDEQELFPEYRTYEYETMFDEVYHARTAYEITHGLSIYEITHPPLGKCVMSLGIRAFGMTPFGWRVCALFGTMMVPLCYVFMWAVSKNSWISAFTTALLVFDFMHFTLSRIGTIDIIVACFILLTFYLMYLVLKRLKHGIDRCTVLLMILNGCAAGAAMATKWTGVYAGAGIALMFFLFLMREYIPAHGKRDILTLFGICVAAYLCIPAVIYVLSYLSYPMQPGEHLLKKMWDNQVLMLTYHESTVFDHPYSSEWYEWIWMKRPLLDAYTTLPDGKISVVATFGNPLIWWAGVPAFFFNLYQWQVKKDERTGYLCICYLTMLVPWLFIHRTVFIYQYFVCSIVLILLLGNTCRFLKHAKKAMTLYLVVAGIVFVCFYPVISGAPVDRSFSGQWLKWLSSWPLS